MSLLCSSRASESSFVEMVMHAQAEKDGLVIRPATFHWHMVIVRYAGISAFILVGPWTASGPTSWIAGADITWIQLKLGVFMPEIPIKQFVDTELVLPPLERQHFWFHHEKWQLPDYDNADTFIQQLIRQNLLRYDPLIQDVTNGLQSGISPRTLRERFKRATGVSHSFIRQMQRAEQAQSLLSQGVSILDTIDALAYTDQPHLTRSLKKFIGYTPGEIFQHKEW